MMFFFLLVWVLVTGEHTTESLAIGASADPLCKRRCGTKEFSFPYGLDADNPSCYRGDRDDLFALTCNTTFQPPKLFNGDFEVLDISIDNAKMRVLLDISFDCYNASRYRYFFAENDSYSFSYTDNYYVAIGCDTTAYIKGLTSVEYVGGFVSANYEGGCISSCDSIDYARDGDCSGMGCCQTSIPMGLRGYEVSLASSHNSRRRPLEFNPCSYSFLVEKKNYTFRASDLKDMSTTRRFPVVVDWYVGNQRCEVAKENRTSYACISDNSDCNNSTNGPGYFCRCSKGYQGNPYISNGCQDKDECKLSRSCGQGAVCSNTPGKFTCTCPRGTLGDPHDRCRKDPRNQVAILGVSCGLAALLLLFGILMRQKLKVRRLQQQRNKCFQQNHNLLLQQRLLCDKNIYSGDSIKFFSFTDLEKATNNFDSARIVGDGGHGTVYKGLLDLEVVAIKKSKVETQIEKEQFINEVILLSNMRHKNVVSLVGCCLESEVPMLVYEFISNGTLSNHLHSPSCENQLSWDDRLRIATEISYALSYMHRNANVSVYHRDIKSSNILLDEKLIAKVSDFGASRSLSHDETHISTVIQGTFGYLDPEYMHTGRLTEKSDVYSLGVILVELMTGLNPSSIRNTQADSNLVGQFISAKKGDTLLKIVDTSVLAEANRNELERVAELAIFCLGLRGNDRPTIKEVEFTLDALKKGKPKRKIQINTTTIMKTNCLSQEESISFGGSMTTTNSSSIYDIRGQDQPFVTSE